MYKAKHDTGMMGALDQLKAARPQWGWWLSPASPDLIGGALDAHWTATVRRTADGWRASVERRVAPLDPGKVCGATDADVVRAFEAAREEVQHVG